jgi:SPP1 gp7 family putative phage head morphogenesis protein
MQQLDLPEVVRQQGKIKRPTTLRPIGPTLTCELELRTAFNKALVKAAVFVRQHGLPLVKSVGSELTVDAPSDVLRFIEMLRVLMSREADQLNVDILEAYLSEEARHRKNFVVTVRAATGIDIGAVVRSPDVRPHVEAASIRTAQLIRGVGDELAKKVGDRIIRGAVQGERSAKVAKDLAEQFGWSRKRSKLIARDQTASLNASLNKTRQSQVGVSEYEWSTSLDERVRPLHASFEGNRYRWDEPGPDDGMHPGEPINCRCVAMAVIPGLPARDSKPKFFADSGETTMWWQRTRVRDSGFNEFEEHEHPRGPGGRFANKPDDTTKSAKTPRAKKAAKFTKSASVEEHRTRAKKVLATNPAPINSRWRADVKALADEAKELGEPYEELNKKLGESYWRQAQRELDDPRKQDKLLGISEELGYEPPMDPEEERLLREQEEEDRRKKEELKKEEDLTPEQFREKFEKKMAEEAEQAKKEGANPKTEPKHTKDKLWAEYARGLYKNWTSYSWSGTGLPEEEAVDLLTSLLEHGVVEGNTYPVDLFQKMKTAGLSDKSSDEEILKVIKSDARMYTGSFSYPGSKEVEQTYVHTDMVETFIKNIKSKEGQEKVADALVALSPDKWSHPKRVTAAGWTSSMIVRNFRGDVLDKLADGVRKDLVPSGDLMMFSSDFDTFQKPFISSWLMTGGTQAYRRAYAATKDQGVNSGKTFWLGREPLNEGELVPSKNMQKNLSKIYNKTQDFYKQKLGKKYEGATLELQRGVGGHSEAYTPAPVESWTVDKRTPERFGKMMAGLSGEYMILSTTVPVKDVLMSWESMKGVWQDEANLKGKKEIVVFGGAVHGNMEVERKKG